MNTNKTYANHAHKYAPHNPYRPAKGDPQDLPAVIRACLLGIAGVMVIVIGVLLSMNAIANGSNFVLFLGILAGLIGLISIILNCYLYKKEMV